MEEIDVFKSMREAGDSELIPFVDEKEAARLRWSRLEDLFRLCIPSRMAKRSCRYGAWSAYRRYLHTRL